MQDKLARWSSTDKERRFDRLLRLIANGNWLHEAARITLASRGAKTAGVDGKCRIDLQNILQKEINCIQKILLDGSYSPSPAKRVYIPKANGKQRPLGIPTLRDRIVQRAILMVMEPIWESNFNKASYGFRPEKSVHHAIRTVRSQLQDKAYPAGRWVIEGDLASYFDTVHHKLLMKYIRKRIRDKRFLTLIWKLLKAGHIDKGLFYAANKGVPQGGVISPLLSNIMLHEFDQYLERKYLAHKVKRHREVWNRSVKDQIPIAVRQNRQRMPTVSYCRYADDFVIVVSGKKGHAQSIREECRNFLENKLKLTLNMDKTHITHVDDGFVFLGHRIIRKRGSRNKMHTVTTIPKGKFKNFISKIVIELSSNHDRSAIEMINWINRKLVGWANFYRHTDYTATMFGKADGIIFWKLGHWLAKKYRTSIKKIMIKWFCSPGNGKAKTWRIFRKSRNGKVNCVSLRRLVTSMKMQFRYRSPETNPYIIREENRKSISSRYRDVAMAMSHF